jgi:hypothetical protein
MKAQNYEYVPTAKLPAIADRAAEVTAVANNHQAAVAAALRVSSTCRWA